MRGKSGKDKIGTKLRKNGKSNTKSSKNSTSPMNKAKGSDNWLKFIIG